MENGENEKAVDVIVISDDEDSQERTPVIVIEEDENVNGETQPVQTADADNPEKNCQASSPAKRVSSPLEKHKITKRGIKELKAMVKLTKLNIPLNNRTKVKAGVENDKLCDKPATNCSSTEARDVKLEVKTEKGHESKVNSGQSSAPEMGIFELVKKKYNQERQSTKKVFVNTTLNDSNCLKNRAQESTSSNKRSMGTPPSSPSLKQSKLSADSFSPKKRPMLYSCLRQEQPLHYTTPLYCKVTLRKAELAARSKQEASLGKPFSENQMNTIQSLKEENFHKSVLATVTSFMSHHRKPPPNLLFYLVNNILLSKQSNCGTECFRILRQIQALHPVVPMEMVGQKITWEFVSMVVKLSGGTRLLKGDSNLKLNASMALSFLVSVMEEEAQIKTFSLVKTSAHRLLSVNKKSSHIHDVTDWIGQSLRHHRGKQLDQRCGHNFCPLYLLQRMLLLSLLVSERPEDSAARIADDLVVVYVELQSIKHKTLLLQSVQSHLLKTKLIEVIVSNCCPSDVELEAPGVSRLGLRNIVFSDFRRFPPAMSSSIHDPDSDLSLNSVVNTTNCEEFVMLLAYWLQSFVFCRKRSLMKHTSADSLRVLSIDDVDVLREIDEEVLMLRVRLESLCSPSPLSSRSYQLLELISSLKSFAEMVP